MVSVIIPTYNCGQFVQEAAGSVLDQTHGSVEIIVIDDGSTDDTFTKLKSLQNYIQYIWQENGGVSKARNVGLDLAKGEFIAFLDADDIWLPQKLEIQIAFLKRFPHVAGVFSDFSKLKSNGELLEYRSIRRHYPIFKNHKMTIKKIFPNRDYLHINSFFNSRADKIDVYHGNIFKSLFLGNLINTSSIVVRKESMLNVGKFNPLLRTQEDYEYWLRLAKEFDLGYIDQPLVQTRRYPGQLTREDQKEEIAKKSLEIIEEISYEAATILGKKTVSSRLAEKNKTLGLVYLGNRKNIKARTALKKSISYQPLNLSSTFYYYWSFLPPWFAIPLRNFIKKILNLLTLR